MAKKAGRPTATTPEIITELLERLSNGESMVSICRDAHMPHRSTFIRHELKNSDFATECARAREYGCDKHIDDTLAIADAVQNPDDAQVAKVKISARQWYASKLHSKKWGDKVQLDGNLKLEKMSQENVESEFAKLVGKAQGLGLVGGAGTAEKPQQD